jgi:hypothetical protein
MAGVNGMIEWLDTWLKANASDLWTSDTERRNDLRKVVARVSAVGHPSWRVVPQEQRTGNPGHPGGYRTAYVVVRHGDGGVYEPPSEARAQAMARALNAWEARAPQTGV